MERKRAALALLQATISLLAYGERLFQASTLALHTISLSSYRSIASHNHLPMSIKSIWLLLPLLLLCSSLLAGSRFDESLDSNSRQTMPKWWYTVPHAVYVDHTLLSGFKENYKSDGIRVVNDPAYEQSTRIFMTVPILIKKKGFTLTSSLFYNIRYGQYNIDVNGQRVFTNKREAAFTTIAALNLTKVLKIKGKTVVMNGSVAYVARQIHEPQRVTGVVTTMVYLITNKKQSLAVGITGLIDNRALIPVLPVISYTRFMKQNWNLEMLLPAYIRFRKLHSGSFFTSMGIKAESLNSYYTGSWTNNGTVEWRNTNIKAFVGIEKQIFKTLWFNIETGYLNRFNSGFARPDADNRDLIVQGRFASNLYLNFGVFIKPDPTKKRKGK